MAATALAFPRSSHRVPPFRRHIGKPVEIVSITKPLVEEEEPRAQPITGDANRTVLVRITTQSGDFLTKGETPFFRVAFGESGTSIQANHYPIDSYVRVMLDQKRWLIEGVLPTKDARS